jgi:hypothetical protein
VEVLRDKPESERGKYLNPKELGFSEDLSVYRNVREGAEVQAEVARSHGTREAGVSPEPGKE